MVMEKSWNFVISHGILPILPLNCTKCVRFMPPLSINVGSPHFPPKHQEGKLDERDGHGKLRNSHGKVMHKYFVKSVETLKFT